MTPPRLHCCPTHKTPPPAQTYPLGQQAELLVVVQKDGQHATRIVLTTDIQDLVVLHWGVKKSAKADWILPPTGIVPAHSEAHPVRCFSVALLLLLCLGPCMHVCRLVLVRQMLADMIGMSLRCCSTWSR